ncbi:hypothetical protein Tco_0660705 [Tanacetum coccineum]
MGGRGGGVGGGGVQGFRQGQERRNCMKNEELEIGKMTVNEYCTKIQSMANRLKNLDCQVSKKNLVIYAVNGLDSRFATLAEIIRHREPLPTFEMRNLQVWRPIARTVHQPAHYRPVHYQPGPTSIVTPTVLYSVLASNSYPVHTPHVVQYQQPSVQAHQPHVATYQHNNVAAQQYTIATG